MHTKDIKLAGKPISEGGKVLVMIHGRGGSAADILSLARHLKVEDFALLAPQATNKTWYPHSFLASPSQNEPWLSSALQLLSDMEKDLSEQGVHSENIHFLGFSQGACLALEYAARNAKKYGGVIAFTGGLIGDEIYEDHYKGDFMKTPVFIGTSDPDPHVPVARVNATAGILKKMDADTTIKIYKNMGHTISQDEIDRANELVFSGE